MINVIVAFAFENGFSSHYAALEDLSSILFPKNENFSSEIERELIFFSLYLQDTKLYCGLNKAAHHTSTITASHSLSTILESKEQIWFGALDRAV